MITINDLRVYYKDFKALEINEEIKIGPKDRVGVIGSNGAGKSTFIKACLGLLKYDGMIKTEVKTSDMSVHMQFNEYVDTMNTKAIMETILDAKIDNNKKLQDLVHFFDFTENLKKKYKNLSGGEKQRFTLILVLMQDAPITFFDEVTTGLDFTTRQSLMSKILEWYKDKDAAIIFVTHYYEELEQLTNKIMILDKGHLVDFGDRRELFKKYCGYSVISFRKEDLPVDNFTTYRHLHATDEYIALSCSSVEEETILVKELIKQNINFKRSNQDVEILSINAIKEYYS